MCVCFPSANNHAQNNVQTKTIPLATSFSFRAKLSERIHLLTPLFHLLFIPQPPAV